MAEERLRSGLALAPGGVHTQTRQRGHEQRQGKGEQRVGEHRQEGVHHPLAQLVLQDDERFRHRHQPRQPQLGQVRPGLLVEPEIRNRSRSLREMPVISGLRASARGTAIAR